MRIHFSLSALLALQGIHCIQFFVYREGVACTLDYQNGEFQAPKKICIITDRSAIVDYDYHFIQKSVQDVNTSYIVNTLKGSPFNLSSQIINTNALYGEYGMKYFTVDWINNRFYMITEDKLLSGSTLKSNSHIPLDEVISQRDAVVNTGTTEYGVEFHSVKVDPYRRLLFVSVRRFSPDNSFIIIRSDLSGQSQKLIAKLKPERQMKLILNVNEEKLIVVANDVLYTYDYEGKLISQFELPYSPIDLAVFENTVYLTSSKINVIDEASLNQSVSPPEVTNVYHHDLGSDLSSIRILDARLQRRKKDGKYICDRTDCPELCEVVISGDNCVCSHTKAKARDGVMCYVCGQSSLTSLIQEPTIVNGQISSSGNFPWHAVLYNNTKGDLICGGTLISSRVVLTAAHCVTASCVACVPSLTRAEQITVALGKTRLTRDISEPYATYHNVTKILVRNTYLGLSTNFANDIALLFLDSPVSVTGHVMPACLDYNLNQLPDHGTLTGYVSGFGLTKECLRACSNFSENLLYTTGTAIELNQCLNILTSRDPSPFHTLASDKFCMGNGTGSEVQRGDSGGGLTLAYHGLHYVTGVVSVKLLRYRSTVLKYSLGVYTNVSMHMDWIKQNLLEDQ